MRTRGSTRSDPGTGWGGENEGETVKRFSRSVAVAAVFGAATCVLAVPMMSSAGATVSSASPTSVAVISSMNPSIVGQTVKLTAKVASHHLNGLPTGTVTFTIDGVAQAPKAIKTGKSSAGLRISTLTHGTHNVTAHYNGDSLHLASASAVFVQTVN